LIFFLLFIGVFFDLKSMEEKAIKKGYAIYHPTTGDFVWKCDLEVLRDD